MADDKLGDTVAGGDADDGLARLASEVAAVATDDERLALGAAGDGGEGRLDEVFGVILVEKWEERKVSPR